MGCKPCKGRSGRIDISDKEQTSDDDDRGVWANPVEFILSCLGYAVGLGNVWRFPYLCYSNGGGAFLIPYVLTLVFIGLPVFFIELAAGQYSAAGPINVFYSVPIFQGVGIGMLVISFIGSIYYNMIIAWAVYYMFASFQSTLPWSYCTEDSTKYCYSKRQAGYCEQKNGTWANLTCYNETVMSLPSNMTCNGTAYEWEECEQYMSPVQQMLRDIVANRVYPSEEYFNRVMLDRSESIDDTGYLKWDLCLVLLLSWLICFVCIIKGIRSSGKAVYFTATFPYVVLVILFFRGVTLPGAIDGIRFYIVPRWEELLKPKVWVDAAGQIFFSLSVGFGGLMTYASYNKFNNNVYRDTLLVVIANSLTSFFAGFVIFSVLGFMAHQLNVKVSDVVASGTGLAFIAYPEVVTYLPVSQLWSILFFFMLLTLGLDSQFAGIEAVLTGLVDFIPKLRRYRTWVVLTIVIVMYLLGLSMCTQAGVYWVELVSYYASGVSLVLLGLVEAVVFSWVYGARRLLADVEEMVGFRLYAHWWICWKFVTPILLTVIFVASCVDFTPLTVDDYLMPVWAQVLGWLMTLLPICIIPVFAIYKIYSTYRQPELHGCTVIQRIVKLTKPTSEWVNPKDKRFIESPPEGASSPQHHSSLEQTKPPPYEESVTVTNAAYDNDVFDY